LRNLSLLDLLAEDLLEGDGVSGELADALGELVDGHGVLVEVETEEGLVLEVALLLDVELGDVLSLELLGNRVGAVVELLKEVGGDGEVVAASELGDLTDVAEGGAHDNGLVAELLVVVEDLNDGLDTGVVGGVVLLLGVGLVPVEDTADEGRDEVGTGLGGGDGLGKGEHEGQVAVDAVLGGKLVGGLDTLPGRGELDENTLLVNAGLLVELIFLLVLVYIFLARAITYVDDAESLLDGDLLVEGEAGVNLSGDLAGNDLENLATELDKKVVESDVNLGVDILALAVLHAVRDSIVNELGVLGLLGGGEDEGRVGGGILRLVLANGGEVTRVADDGLWWRESRQCLLFCGWGGLSW
jgi:hypothetical protein